MGWISDTVIFVYSLVRILIGNASGMDHVTLWGLLLFSSIDFIRRLRK